jgi:hypothetical protein
MSAFEKSIRDYEEKLGEDVIDPCLATMFDSLWKAYDFYNVYVWEHGFGIRHRKSRLNARRRSASRRLGTDLQ